MLAALIALGGAGDAAPSQAQDTGKMLIHCQAITSQSANVDPIKDYGVSPSPHNHTPAGAQAFSAFTTLPAMMSAATSCNTQSDHSEIWLPTAYNPDGTVAPYLAIDYYLGNLGYDIQADTPNGLREIGGNPDCNNLYCNSSSVFDCYEPDGVYYVSHHIPAAGVCDPNHDIGFLVNQNAQCWDGVNYGAGMGGTGSAATFGAAGTTLAPDGGKTCANGYPIPFIDVGGDLPPSVAGGYVSSDIALGTQTSCGGCSLHFDYVFGWANDPSDQISSLAKIIANCLDVPDTLNAGTYTQGQASCQEVKQADGSFVVDQQPATGYGIGPYVTR